MIKSEKIFSKFLSRIWSTYSLMGFFAVLSLRSLEFSALEIPAYFLINEFACSSGNNWFIKDKLILSISLFSFINNVNS